MVLKGLFRKTLRQTKRYYGLQNASAMATVLTEHKILFTPLLTTCAIKLVKSISANNGQFFLLPFTDKMKLYTFMALFFHAMEKSLEYRMIYSLAAIVRCHITRKVIRKYCTLNLNSLLVIAFVLHLAQIHKKFNLNLNLNTIRTVNHIIKSTFLRIG